MFALFVCFGGTIGLLDRLDYGKHVITIDYGKQDDEGNKNGYRKQVEAEKLLNNVRNNIWTMRNYFRNKSTIEIMFESVADYRE